MTLALLPSCLLPPSLEILHLPCYSYKVSGDPAEAFEGDSHLARVF